MRKNYNTTNQALSGLGSRNVYFVHVKSDGYSPLRFNARVMPAGAGIEAENALIVLYGPTYEAVTAAAEAYINTLTGKPTAPQQPREYFYPTSHPSGRTPA